MGFLDRPSMGQPTLYFVHLLMLTLAAHSIGHWLLSATLHLPLAARDNWYDSVSCTNVEYLPWQSLLTRVRGGVVSQVLTIFIGINHANFDRIYHCEYQRRVSLILVWLESKLTSPKESYWEADNSSVIQDICCTCSFNRISTLFSASSILFRALCNPFWCRQRSHLSSSLFSGFPTEILLCISYFYHTCYVTNP
jgi:hypothetical protein